MKFLKGSFLWIFETRKNLSYRKENITAITTFKNAISQNCGCLNINCKLFFFIKKDISECEKYIKICEYIVSLCRISWTLPYVLSSMYLHSCAISHRSIFLIWYRVPIYNSDFSSKYNTFHLKDKHVHVFIIIL